MTLRLLQGGSSESWMHFGPKMVMHGYPTVVHGWAKDIEPKTGEVAVMWKHGTAYYFAEWVIGDPGEVLDWLLARMLRCREPDPKLHHPEEADRLRWLAERLSAATKRRKTTKAHALLAGALVLALSACVAAAPATAPAGMAAAETAAVAGTIGYEIMASGVAVVGGVAMAERLDGEDDSETFHEQSRAAAHRHSAYVEHIEEAGKTEPRATCGEHVRSCHNQAVSSGFGAQLPDRKYGLSYICGECYDRCAENRRAYPDEPSPMSGIWPAWVEVRATEDTIAVCTYWHPGWADLNQLLGP